MSTLEDFSTVLQRLAVGEKLTQDASARAFATLMAGDVSPVRMSAFLTAFAVRDATTEEIVGAARAMRLAMRRIEAPDGAIDLCGTGGDGHGTLNVSTAAAFVVAACGVPVAKHGNRNMSSRTGTADVLEALGVRIDLEPQAAERCLREAGICFLFAQSYHPSMKHVAPIRRELGFRTIFNLLGPLSNPGGVRRQLLGVYSRDWLVPVAHVLAKLGAEKAWVVHGSDGLDEMTTTGVTPCRGAGRRQGHDDDRGAAGCRASNMQASQPSRAALPSTMRTPSANSSAARRARFATSCCSTRRAALVVADKARDLKDGIARAAQAIDSGAAANVLAKLESVSQGLRA